MNKLTRIMTASSAAIALSVAFSAGSLNALAAANPNVPANAIVKVTGTPLPPPAIPANAITLAPGQSIPANAPVGQAYVLP